MKSAFLLTLVVLLTNLAPAEVRRSSRNLKPLTKPSDSDTRSNDEAASQQPAVAPQNEPAPSQVAKVAFRGPKTGWGVVKTSAPFYSPQGKNLGTLPGGMLFTYTDVKDSSKNSVLVSSVKRGETWEGPYLLDCTAVVTYEGAPDKIDPAILHNLTDYFTIKGKIDERKEALADSAASVNPYYKTAKQALQAYQDSIEKAAEMEKQMSTLTGPRKIKADEALRAFKYEQVRIKTKADQAALAYKTWKNAHPTDPAKIAADPQLKTLEQELQAAAAKVTRLLPPES